jgi:hypothetical protein
VTKNRCSRASLVFSIAIGVFLIGATSAQASQDPFNNGCVAEVGGINHPSCTANDVRLTTIVEGSLVIFGNCSGSQALCEENTDCPAGQTCDGKGCTADPTDTVTFSATGKFVAGPQRYDVGLYIASDTDSDANGARFGSCTRFAFDNGEGTPALPSLDNDECGDVNPNSTTQVDFGPVTIFCVDAKSPGATIDDPPVNTPDGQADINHCETWAQRVNEINCQDSEDVRAGTGSKCFCGLLAGACIAISDGSDCTRDVCQGTCQTSTGGGSHTTCEDNGDCPVSGETCRSITLQHIGDTTVECRPAAGDCDIPETCAADGSCPADVLKAGSVECRPSACGTGIECCDLAENCTGSSADCPGDGFKPAGTVCRLSDGSTCDPPETCSGSSASCGPDVCLGDISHP